MEFFSLARSYTKLLYLFYFLIGIYTTHTVDAKPSVASLPRFGITWKQQVKSDHVSPDVSNEVEIFPFICPVGAWKHEMDKKKLSSLSVFIHDNYLKWRV